MTGYSPSDLGEDWEFKILRSNTNAFRNPEKFRAALEEEQQAGWTLVEKFDNGRIRLKRPSSCRALDGKREIDPYRTVIGIGEGKQVAIIIGSIFGVIAIALILIALLLASR